MMLSATSGPSFSWTFWITRCTWKGVADGTVEVEIQAKGLEQGVHVCLVCDLGILITQMLIAEILYLLVDLTWAAMGQAGKAHSGP
jgi:hypothetical protein